MTDAILLIGHGSVDDPAEIPDFVRTIRQGRPTPQSIIDEVDHRWRVIGGSPLQRIVEELSHALQGRVGIPVGYGSRLWKPWARDTVESLKAGGATRILSLPLAPFSVHVYNPVVRAACAGVECIESPPWGEEPALIDAFAAVLGDALREVPDAHVLFTAHSLPTRVVRAGDPYEGQVRATARLVAERLGISHWSVAFQSQGMDGGDWLGPDLPTALSAIEQAAVVVCAIGFLADHTEVLYDLDVEARAIAEARGLQYKRASSLNVHPQLVEALARTAHRSL